MDVKRSFFFVIGAAALTVAPFSLRVAWAAATHMSQCTGLFCAGFRNKEMQAAYEHASNSLPASERKGFDAEQVSWERWVSIGCKLDNKSASGETTDDMCLDGAMSERTYDLSHSIGHFAGRTIYVRRRFYIDKSPDGVATNDGSFPGFTALAVSAQLIEPSSQAVHLWNLHEMQGLRASNWPHSKDEDVAASTTIVGLSREYISTHTLISTFTHGDVHPEWSDLNQIFLLKVNRKLVDSDLFGKGKAWQAPLGRLCRRGFDNADKHGPAYRASASSLRDEVSKADDWTLSNRGLRIWFSIGVLGGSYGEGGQACEISWKDLKPLLASHSLVSEPLKAAGGSMSN